MAREIVRTDPERERSLGRVALWLDPDEGEVGHDAFAEDSV
jgi:hypothetical protein